MAFTLFKMKKPHTQEDAVQKLADALKLLEEYHNDAKAIESFKAQVMVRQNEFTIALQKNQKNTSERQQIVEQYYRFANTLHHCMAHPKNAPSYTHTYHEENYYHPVGSFISKPSASKRYASLAAATIGTALIIAAFATFALNPLLTCVMLPIGIAVLTLGIFSLCMKGPVNTDVIKWTERTTFETGAKLCTNKPEQNSDYSYTNVA